MSMIRCDECDRLIDSDDDPDCFGEFGKAEATLCKWCREAMEINDDPDSAEVQIERRIDFLVRELDEFTAMANNPETIDLIEKEAIGIGQVRFRAQLILAFLEARKPNKFRVISNG